MEYTEYFISKDMIGHLLRFTEGLDIRSLKIKNFLVYLNYILYDVEN